MIALKNLARCAPMRGRSLAEISTFLQPQRRNSQASSTKDNTTTNGTSGLVNLLNKLDGPRLGQPTCVSHPHLILPHELVPGLTLAEFQQRRIELMQKIQSYASTFGDNYNGRSTKNHMLIVGAASKKYMSGKIPYVFRQNSDFYYLTGCLEPDSVLVMTIDQGSNVESMLFMRPRMRMPNCGTVHSDIIGMIGSIGGETLDQLFQSTCYRLGKYLQEIGLVSRASDDYKTVVSQGYRFCPHHVSHYLGMDVHDTPNIPRSKALEPGMVFTVEPGVYIGEDCTDVPAEFRGIGIRIEDDLLISQDGVVEVLTAECIKDRQRLEHLCQQVSVETDSVSASASDSA
ncbi:GL12918 [Drosophila persimilis]|uniref:GL12918 n=1 Tax=Drosophila persimilis TaxID=7234 RepID=B4GV22_DROPE|nr:GL12918 [Drosophila persimilis]